MTIVRCPIHGIAFDAELEGCPECAKGVGGRGKAWVRWARASAVIVSVLLLASCAAAPPIPTPPPVTRQPELIPLWRFFASRDANWGYRVSPDGTRLGWITSHRGRTTIHFRVLGQDTVGVVDTHTSRNIFWFTWARDSRRVLYLRDQDGDENYHVYLASTERPDEKPVDLTPWPGSRSWVHRVVRSDPEHVIIESNGRDKTVFDLYRVNLTTFEQVLLAENPGDVVQWLTGWDGGVRARIRHVGPHERRLELRRAEGWVEVQRHDLEEFNVQLLGVTPDDRGLWLLSSRGRDRLSLVRVDMETGAEALVYAHPTADLESVVLSERTRAPLAIVAVPDRQSIHFFDAGLAEALRGLRRDVPTGLFVRNFDDDERLVTVEVYTEKGSENYLVDRRSKEHTLLGRSHTLAFESSLAITEPIAFKARDRLLLRGYLTRPLGVAGPGPMVLVVHGGHWWRDYWGYDRVVQFLANRGYAVLQVNYRGSTGYGRTFRELAVGEYAGKMHDDLVDGVRWAVERGIADPARVAIYGASYGGYATLVGMTFTPEVFACGVDVVGMSNLVTLYENAPPYWKLTALPLFNKYVGDPSRPEDRRRMEAKSPLFKADLVQRPLLIIHGARDARVNVQESERMVAALQRAGKDVRYVVFPDEGHRRDYGNWRNALKHYSEVESFLAQCLGGRSS